MALFVGYLFFGGGEEDNAGELATAQTKLFGEMPPVRCSNPVECDTRAHDAYFRAKKYLAQAGGDPGNLYRATLELDKAARFREQSGRPLADMADVGALEEQARARAEAEFADAKFRLQRAIAAGDNKRCAVEAAALAAHRARSAASLSRQARRLSPHAAQAHGEGDGRMKRIALVVLLAAGCAAPHKARDGAQARHRRHAAREAVRRAPRRRQGEPRARRSRHRRRRLAARRAVLPARRGARRRPSRR